MDYRFRPGEDNPAAVHRRLRARGNVFWDDIEKGWFISGYDSLKKVLMDQNKYTSEDSIMSEVFGREAMLVNDTPLHNKIRGVWSKSVSMSVIRSMSVKIDAISKETIAPFADRLRAGDTVDLVPMFQHFTCGTIAALMSIPRDRNDDYQRWNSAITGTTALTLLEGDPVYNARQAAKDEFSAFIEQQIVERKRALTEGGEANDLVSLLAAAEGRDGITPSIVRDNLLNLLIGALDTTVRWLGNIFAVFQRNPQILADLRNDPALLSPCIEEAMRLETPVQLIYRRVRDGDACLDGKTLAEGDQLFLLLGAGNRDPDIFESPDQFDIHRKSRMHLGFGFGMHQCLGLNIARQEVASLMRHFLATVSTFEVVDCRYEDNWVQWGPVALELRAPRAGNARFPYRCLPDIGTIIQ